MSLGQISNIAIIWLPINQDDISSSSQCLTSKLRHLAPHPLLQLTTARCCFIDFGHQSWRWDYSSVSTTDLRPRRCHSGGSAQNIKWPPYSAARPAFHYWYRYGWRIHMWVRSCIGSYSSIQLSGALRLATWPFSNCDVGVEYSRVEKGVNKEPNIISSWPARTSVKYTVPT